MLRMPRFLKRWIKRHTTPVPHEVALKTREKLSLAYAFTAWLGLSVVAYWIYGSKDWDKTKPSHGRYFADAFRKNNVTLVQLRNTQKVGQWDLNEEKRTYGHLLSEEELEELERKRKEQLTGDAAVVEQLI